MTTQDYEVIETKKQGHSTFSDHFGLRVSEGRSGEGGRRGRHRAATRREIQNVHVLFLSSSKDCGDAGMESTTRQRGGRGSC
jgi:hypothetical protein